MLNKYTYTRSYTYMYNDVLVAIALVIKYVYIIENLAD